MLTRKAFRKPSLYKGMHQTKSDVSDIIKFMVNRIGDIGVKVSFSFKAFHQSKITIKLKNTFYFISYPHTGCNF